MYNNRGNRGDDDDNVTKHSKTDGDLDGSHTTPVFIGNPGTQDGHDVAPEGVD